jgi:hypothetical protein
MLRTSRILLVGVIAMAMTVLGAASAAAQQDERTKATEIGVTAKEIRIAVIADVDNPFAPGVFKGAVDGVKGAAKYINSKAGGGGLAGRKLKVDFIDSHLNANDSRNGVITACGQDFAMVGNFMLFLSNVDDEVNCADQAGAATGIPDLASVATGVPQACSPVAYPVSPAQLVCATKDQPEQTYYCNQFTQKYLLKQHDGDLHGALLFASDTQDARRSGNVLVDVAVDAGVEADQTVPMSGRAPQSAYTPVVAQMKADDSNYAYSVSAAAGTILLRSEAQLQGLRDDITWVCTIACYDNAVRDQADVMEGQYVEMTFLPFEEAKTNKTLGAFLEYVGKDNANGFAVYGWTATLAFKQAVEAVVEREGVNGLTRANLLSSGIDALTEFDAGGMIGSVDIKNKVSTTCAAIVQLQKGAYVRVSPSKKGTFNCDKSNRIQVEADLIGG